MAFPGKDEKDKKQQKWLRHSVAVFFIFLFLLSVLYLGFNNVYKNRVMPRIKVAGTEMGGKTKEEAKEELNKMINQVNESGVVFFYGDKEVTINPIISSFEGDIAFSIINFDAQKTIDDIYSLGRQDNFLKNTFFKINSLFYETRLPIKVSVKKEQLVKILEENYKNIEKKAKNASLTATTTWENRWEKKVEFKINPEREGFKLNYEKAAQKLESNLSDMDISPIEIEASRDLPEIKMSDVLNAKSRAKDILKKAPLSLTFRDNRWIVDKEELASWLGLSKGVKDMIIISLKKEPISEYLKEKVATEIEKDPVNAKFEIKEGRVVEFQTSEDGLRVDVDKTISKINNQFLAGTSKETEIAIQKIESQVKTENVNDLGIKEIIGTGHSNFAGSPNNRVHNIKNGAESISGILIGPGEEFSLVDALGEINAETGYLPELVIKGNRTIPEYGGGLCQIGTTIFRTALQAGLPITARRNHSYRVSYYEPAGTDATIYDPWPDLKFINDTGNHILIQHRIDGNDIYFDFWGTDDGREVEITDPTIYNIVQPGPTKMVETTDLDPGEKKCTESAHAGADAHFDYKVEYPEGETKERRFKSHYVPWRAVCLIGVEEKEAATSTPEKTE